MISSLIFLRGYLHLSGPIAMLYPVLTLGRLHQFVLKYTGYTGSNNIFDFCLRKSYGFMIWVHMSLPSYDRKWSLNDNVGIKRRVKLFSLGIFDKLVLNR